MTEKELQKLIIDVAHLFGWMVAHFRSVETKRQGWQTPVQADGQGFPDLCLVRDRVVFVEVKVGYNKLSVHQERWRDRIIASGTEWYEWREDHWQAGEVEKVLR
jgi:hypothetical protein